MRQFFADEETAGTVASPVILFVKFAAIIAALCLGDFADQTGIDPLFSLLIHIGVMKLKADLQKSSRLLRGSDHLLNFSQSHAHRFFAQHRLIGLQTLERLLRMQGIGRGDDRHFY